MFDLIFLLALANSIQKI